MANRVESAAFAVLKENSKKIKVEQIGPYKTAAFVLSIKRADLPLTQLAEIYSAIYALSSGTIEINVKDGADLKVTAQTNETVNLKTGQSIENHPIGRLARILADNGVNFMGSERYKSPKIE